MGFTDNSKNNKKYAVFLPFHQSKIFDKLLDLSKYKINAMPETWIKVLSYIN